MKRLLPALAEQHAQIAERDEQQRGAQFVEQTLGDEHEIFVLERIGLARVVLERRQFKRLLAVGRDERKRGEIQMMHRLGIEAEPHAAFTAERLHAFEQRLGHHAFAVVAHDDGVGAGDGFLQRPQESPRIIRR